MKILFAGGGTGGHVYPAIAMAQAFRKNGEDIHFVGTKSHVEATIVPQNGFDISFIWISGFQRSLDLRNLLFPIKLIVSLVQSFLLIMKHKPELVIGTGGYVSGPVLFMAALMGKKTMIQEQNSYPGVTTRLLSGKVNRVHIAYESAKKYIKNYKKIIITGNPVRENNITVSKAELYDCYKLIPRMTITIIGGSLGAKSVNEAISKLLKSDVLNNVNVIWQTGTTTFEQFKSFDKEGVVVQPYFENMNEIYAITDLIICRAGAMSLAEVAVNEIPALIVPYKYAAGNHQFHNAKSLEEGGAGIVILDDESLENNLKQHLVELLDGRNRLNNMSSNMKIMSFPNATNDLVNSGYELVK